MVLANEVKPFLELSRGPHRDDVFSVEKQLALTLYYLRDQGSILMTANVFGVALCTVSVVVRIVRYVLTNKCELNVIKLPTTEQEMMELGMDMGMVRITIIFVETILNYGLQLASFGYLFHTTML